jgi:hypothetical protein
MRARGCVAMRRDEDHRGVALRADAPRCLDAVHRTGQANVHQNQVDVEVDGLFDRAVAVGHQSANFQALIARQRFQVPGDQQFIFDDQHARRMPP